MPAQLVDPDGNPISTELLKQRQAEPKLTSVRQVEPEHPSWGLSPDGLGTILRDSERHDPRALYALLDDVYEKEWHYRGVMGTRRMALAQLPVTVDPASDDKAHIQHADDVRLMLGQPEMIASKFDLSDALNKGIAFSEIDWDTSARQWMPKRLIFTDQRWFQFDRIDLTTPRLLDDNGQPQPLVPYKWLVHRPRLFSGLPIRDGLGRTAVWAWMFKNFDIKSWLIFLDRFGQPLRLGIFPASATAAEKSALLKALRNMGRDAAAIIPEGMKVDFPKADGAAGGGDSFKQLADYCDEQLSKVVLGQTGTTDASKGGYAVGKVHEGVKDAICLYDGLMLATSLSRSLVRPFIDLNYGPQVAYPTVKIGVGEDKDIDALVKNIGDMVDRGLEVEQSQVYPLLGLTEPAKGPDVKLLVPVSRPMPGAEPGSAPPLPQDDRAGRGGGGAPRGTSALSADPAAPAPRDSFDQATARVIADAEWVPQIDGLEEALAKCTTADEARQVLAQYLDLIGTDELARLIIESRFVGRLAGDTSGTS
jgi:phage gp29-like protein